MKAMFGSNVTILHRCQMTFMASRITGQWSACSVICLDWQQRNIKGPRYCPFVRGIHRAPVDSPHKGTVTRKMFPFDDVIIKWTVNIDSFTALRARSGWLVSPSHQTTGQVGQTRLSCLQTNVYRSGLDHQERRSQTWRDHRQGTI